MLEIKRYPKLMASIINNQSQSRNIISNNYKKLKDIKKTNSTAPTSKNV